MASFRTAVVAFGLGSAAGFKLRLPGPGTGMEPAKITPFAESHVDGFMSVACVKDDMHSHGDKHGDGKGAYKLGEVSGVSIIRYTEMVAKMDQKPMTPKVCFAFCRTVPDMIFFSITNGRDCYCAPYYKQIAGDSSICDAPCVGDPSVVCGGKTKSSVYSMYACVTNTITTTITTTTTTTTATTTTATTTATATATTATTATTTTAGESSMCDQSLIGTPLRFDPHSDTGPTVTPVPHYFYEKTLEFEKIASQTMPAFFDQRAQDTFLMNEDDATAEAYMSIGRLDKNDPTLLIDGKYHFKIIYDCEYVIEWEQDWWLDFTGETGKVAHWGRFQCLAAPRRSGEGNKLFEGDSYKGAMPPDCNGRSAAQSGQSWNGLRKGDQCPNDDPNAGCAVLDAGSLFNGGAVGMIDKPYIGDKMWSYATGERGATKVELWIARKKQ